MNNIETGFNGDSWWSRVRVTATGEADLKAAVTSTAAGAGTGRQRRLVVTGWSIYGQNTNAAATTFSIRNKTTTTTIFKDGGMVPTSGTFSSDVNGVNLVGAANEAIELTVGGALTGFLSVVLWGRVQSADSPFQTRNVTGAP